MYKIPLIPSFPSTSNATSYRRLNAALPNSHCLTDRYTGVSLSFSGKKRRVHRVAHVMQEANDAEFFKLNKPGYISYRNNREAEYISPFLSAKQIDYLKNLSGSNPQLLCLLLKQLFHSGESCLLKAIRTEDLAFTSVLELYKKHDEALSILGYTSIQGESCLSVAITKSERIFSAVSQLYLENPECLSVVLNTLSIHDESCLLLALRTNQDILSTVISLYQKNGDLFFALGAISRYGDSCLSIALDKDNQILRSILDLYKQYPVHLISHLSLLYLPKLSPEVFSFLLLNIFELLDDNQLVDFSNELIFLKQSIVWSNKINIALKGIQNLDDIAEVFKFRIIKFKSLLLSSEGLWL